MYEFNVSSSLSFHFLKLQNSFLSPLHYLLNISIWKRLTVLYSVCDSCFHLSLTANYLWITQMILSLILKINHWLDIIQWSVIYCENSYLLVENFLFTLDLSRPIVSNEGQSVSKNFLVKKGLSIIYLALPGFRCSQKK